MGKIIYSYFIFFITFFFFFFWNDEDWVKGIISDQGGGEVDLSLESDAVVLMKDCYVLSVVCVCCLHRADVGARLYWSVLTVIPAL